MNTTLSYELVAAEASRCGIFILMGPIAFTCLPVKRIANSFAGLNLTNGYTGRAVKDVIDSSLNLIVRIQEIRQCSTRSNSLRAAGGGARVIRPPGVVAQHSLVSNGFAVSPLRSYPIG